MIFVLHQIYISDDFYCKFHYNFFYLVKFPLAAVNEGFSSLRFDLAETHLKFTLLIFSWREKKRFIFFLIFCIICPSIFSHFMLFMKQCSPLTSNEASEWVALQCFYYSLDGRDHKRKQAVTGKSCENGVFLLH